MPFVCLQHLSLSYRHSTHSGYGVVLWSFLQLSRGPCCKYTTIVHYDSIVIVIRKMSSLLLKRLILQSVSVYMIGHLFTDYNYNLPFGSGDSVIMAHQGYPNHHDHPRANAPSCPFLGQWVKCQQTPQTCQALGLVTSYYGCKTVCWRPA